MNVDPKRCSRHIITNDWDPTGNLATTQCPNLPVNGTPFCLEHAEPRGAAVLPLPSPYTTEAPPKPARCKCQVVPAPFLKRALELTPAEVEQLKTAFEKALGSATVGFDEPAQPGWVRRTLARIFR